jgi:hypothetical protein
MTPPRPPPGLQASFERLAAVLPATIGVAIAAPGRAEGLSLGRWPGGVAWSTIKVPLAIAALRHDRSLAKESVVKAITESDNAASERLWSQLGEPAKAAQRVQAIIRETGDATTAVESQRIRPGFTAFGQTRWTLGRQAQFAANLAGIADAAGVVDLMSSLVADQRWGLAAKGVAAKGGWGSGLDHGYLVRQFGIVPTESGRLGVALAAESRTFETGVDVVNQMTEWLFGNLAELAPSKPHTR